jgi:hypothetical protein
MRKKMKLYARPNGCEYIIIDDNSDYVGRFRQLYVGGKISAFVRKSISLRLGCSPEDINIFAI